MVPSENNVVGIVVKEKELSHPLSDSSFSLKHIIYHKFPYTLALWQFLTDYPDLFESQPFGAISHLIPPQYAV